METLATGASERTAVREQEQNLVQMRHELKHIINNTDYLLLKSRLSKLFKFDKHAGAHGEYRVRSLYFDTPEDTALKDKINGVDFREKFRMRIYNGDDAYIRLEKKIRRNGLCAKQNAVLSRREAENLLAGKLDWLRERKDPLLYEFYAKMLGGRLMPKTIVEYIREPFVFPAGNVRITLDRDIRSGLYSVGFFDHGLPLADTCEAFAVLEVKYDSFIPDIVAMAVQIPDVRHTSFSKYAVCRKYD